MKISIGSDHGGYKVKEALKKALVGLKHRLKDAGTDNDSGCDYPDFAKAVAEDVSRGESERGILVCGSGVGMSITANKFKGVRAALVWNERIAALSREHNDANILCLPGRFISADEALEIVKIWLATDFAGGRHARRIEKIKSIEDGIC